MNHIQGSRAEDLWPVRRFGGLRFALRLVVRAVCARVGVRTEREGQRLTWRPIGGASLGLEAGRRILATHTAV